MLNRRTLAVGLAALLLAAPGCRRNDHQNQANPDAGTNPQTGTTAEPGQAAPGVAPNETVPGQAPPPSADIRPNANDRNADAIPPASTPSARPPRTASQTRSTASSSTSTRGSERDVPVPATGGGGMQEAPAPARQVEPVAPRIHTLPVGTVIDVEMLDNLSSATSQPGDGFRARVTRPVSFDGVNVIPAGAELSGTVTAVKKLAKIGGHAELALEFSRLELPNGHAATLHGTVMERGKSETGRDVATIGGATAGGAVLGRVLSKKQRDRNTAIGAVIGAAAGTVIASRSQGEQVELPAGAPLSFKLDAPADVPVTR